MSKNQTNTSYQCIDFDLKFNEFNRILFLVRDALSNASNVNYQCDSFDESECHHLDEQHDSFTTSKCTYCQFVKLLKENNTNIKVNSQESELVKSNNVNKHLLNIRYKTSEFAPQMLEWSEYQPNRSPYALLAFASCHNQKDLSKALKNYQALKKNYKNTLIVSKLFIDFHMKHEMSEEFQRSFAINSSDVNKVVTLRRQASQISIGSQISNSTIDLAPAPFNEDQISLLSQNLPQNVISNDNNSELESQVDLLNLRNNETNELTKQLDVFEPIQIKTERDSLQKSDSLANLNLDKELNEELKSLEKEIVYLDFLFAKNGAESKLTAILESEKAKVKTAIQEMAMVIYKRLYIMAQTVNINDEKQLNYYSEWLKTPLDKKSNEKEENAFSISIKVFNKKSVQARMSKFKADLFLCLNHLDLAVFNYSHAYNTARKEHEFMWANSALHGLCISSNLYYENLKYFSSESELNKNNQSFSKDIRLSLKKISFNSNKDIQQVLTAFEDLPKNYLTIIQFLNRNESTKFMAYEIALMITKFFMQKEKRAETLEFINFTIYISNLNIREEDRIRRYLEIGNLYDRLGLKRLGAFYKWISAGRIFKLIEKRDRQTDNYNLKCLVSRCTNQLLDIFENMKIFPQQTPVMKLSDTYMAKMGFPLAKKYLIGQVFQLFHINNFYFQSVKYCKYLVHEMFDHLDKNEFKNFMDQLLILLSKYEEFAKTNDVPNTKQTSFLTTFYRFPQINSFKIESNKTEFVRMGKIEENVTQSNSIYIHRYQNPLINARKKLTYTLPINRVNQVEFVFTNPLETDLAVDYINLLIEPQEQQQEMNEPSDNYCVIELFLLKSDENKRSFDIPAKSKHFQLKFGFVYANLAKFKIIGYEICTLKTLNSIKFSEVWSEGNGQKKDNQLETSYNVEMIPKLPVINDLILKQQDINKNTEKLSSLSESKVLKVNSKLGTCEQFQLDFVFENDFDSNDFDLFEQKLVVQKDLLIEKMNIQIELIKRENVQVLTHQTSAQLFAIRIDSSNYTNIPVNNVVSDEQNPEQQLETNCFIEIKFTNAFGRLQNSCHIFRAQLLIKFEQIVQLLIDDIVDLSEDKFQLNLKINNLLDQEIYLKETCNSSLRRIEPTKISSSSSLVQVQMDIEKFDLNRLGTCEEPNELTRMINEKLNIQFALSDDQSTENLFHVKLGLSNEMNKYVSKLFKCPIELSAQVFELGQAQLNALLVLARLRSNELAHEQKPFRFVLKLTKQAHIIMFPNTSIWNLNEEELKGETKRWCKQWNLVRNSPTQNDSQLSSDKNISLKLSMQFKNNETSYKEMMNWHFNFNLAKSFDYSCIYVTNN